MKRIDFSPTAIRPFLKLPRPAQQHIEAKLTRYVSDGAGDVTAMQGMSGTFRLRCGDYRVLFSETGEVLTVLHVGHRRDVYK